MPMISRSCAFLFFVVVFLLTILTGMHVSAMSKGNDGIPGFIPFISENTPPAISAPTPPTAWVNESYTYSFNVTGVPQPTVTVTGLPAWLVFSSSTNQLQGTPAAADEGSVANITINADNGISPAASVNIAISVLRTGALKWRAGGTAGDMVHTDVTIAQDGTVYTVGFLSGQPRIFATNPDGTPKWNYAFPSLLYPDFDGVVVSHNGNIITTVFGSEITAQSDPYFIDFCEVWAITPGGTVAWRSRIQEHLHPDIPYILQQPGVNAQGTIYVAGDGHDGKFLYAFNPDGTTKWSVVFDDEVDPSQPSARITPCGKPSIGKDRVIYLNAYYPTNGSMPARLLAFDPSGQFLWVGPQTASQTSAAIASDGTLYLNGIHASSQYSLMAVDPADGSIKWQRPDQYGNYPSTPFSEPVVTAEGLYVTNQNLLMAVAHDGTHRWAIQGLPFWRTDNRRTGSPIIAKDGTLFVQNSYNQVLAYTVNGDLRWTLTLSGPDFGLQFRSNLALAPDGSIVMGREFRSEAGSHDGLIAIHSSAGPLSTTASWPKISADAENSGRAHRLLIGGGQQGN